jgi:hypothetical protein
VEKWYLRSHSDGDAHNCDRENEAGSGGRARPIDSGRARLSSPSRGPRPKDSPAPVVVWLGWLVGWSWRWWRGPVRLSGPGRGAVGSGVERGAGPAYRGGGAGPLHNACVIRE